MHELRARLLVRTCDQFAKGTIDRDEYSVAFVERESPDERAIWPTTETLFNLEDERIKRFTTVSAHTLAHMSLQAGGIKLTIVITRQTLSRREQLARYARTYIHFCVVR